MKRILRYAAIIIATVVVAACGRKPEPAPVGPPGGVDGLRDSFAQQLGANKFIKDFQRKGDDLTFSGPGADGGEAKWRVHIDSAVIEPNTVKEGERDVPNEAEPYKGTVKSSWYSNNQLITPGSRESHLPLELMDNGLAQDCWAMWDKAAKKWGWE